MLYTQIPSLCIFFAPVSNYFSQFGYRRVKNITGVQRVRVPDPPRSGVLSVTLSPSADTPKCVRHCIAQACYRPSTNSADG